MGTRRLTSFIAVFPRVFSRILLFKHRNIFNTILLLSVVVKYHNDQILISDIDNDDVYMYMSLLNLAYVVIPFYDRLGLCFNYIFRNVFEYIIFFVFVIIQEKGKIKV